jgi:hypothetical protein
MYINRTLRAYEPNTVKIIWRDSVYIRGRAFNELGSPKGDTMPVSLKK